MMWREREESGKVSGNETKKAVNSVALLTNLFQEMDCTEFKMLTNTVLIGKDAYEL